MAWRWAPLLAAGAELAVLAPSVRLLSFLFPGALPPGWLLAAVLFGGAGAALLAHARMPRLGAARLALALAGALAAGLLPLASTPYDALAALVFGAAWWRGVAAAQYGRSAQAAPGAVLGLAAFAAVPLLLQTLLAVPGWSAAAAADYLLLFACSLGLLAAARSETLRRRRKAASGHWSASGPLAAVAGASLILLPALVVWGASDLSLRTLAGAMALAGRGLGTVLLWLAVAVVWVLQVPLQALITLLRRVRPDNPPALPPPPGDWLEAVPAQPQALPPGLARALGFLGLALLLALVGAVVYRSVLRHWQQPDGDGAGEERESTFTWAKLWRRRPPAPPGAADDPGAGTAGRVRLLYRRLQQAGAAAGRPRRRWETPAEYLAALAETPLPPALAEAITALYTAVRYADQPPPPAAVAAAEAAAQHLPGGESRALR